MNSPARSSNRSLVINISLMVVAFGLLAWVIRRNWDDIFKIFKNPVDYRALLLGFGIYLVALITTFFRWHQLVRAQGLTFSFRDACRLGFIGNVFNLVIPGAVGGDVIKAAFLCRMQPDKKPKAVASMVLDRILGLLGLFILAGVAGGIAWGSADRQVRILIALVWIALATGLTTLAVVFSPNLYHPLNRLVAGRRRLESIVQELERIGLAYRERLGLVIGMLGVATLVHGLYVLAFYSASSAIFPNLPTLAEHYLMVPLALFTTAVPLPFGAIGLVEGISGQLFAMVHHNDGAIAMMAFRILMYGSGVVSALVYLANLRQIRGLTQTKHSIIKEAAQAESELVPPPFDHPSGQVVT